MSNNKSIVVLTNLGNKRFKVDGNYIVAKLIAWLVEHLNLPTQNQFGKTISYRLKSRRTSRFLPNVSTLDATEIQELDELELVSEVLLGSDDMKCVAVVLGVSEYDRFQSLPACSNDARAIADILMANSKYDDVLLLTTRDNTSDVAKRQIKEFLGRYKHHRVKELFFYFSGHGHFDDADFYHILRNSLLTSLAETALSLSELDGWLRDLNPELTVKVIDACRSGRPYLKGESALPSEFDDLKSYFARKYGGQSKGGFRNLYFLFSSSAEQDSYIHGHLSDFTLGVIDTVRSHKGDQLRYSELHDALTKRFSHNIRQNPYFILQGSLNEVFTIIPEELRTKLRNLVLNRSDSRSDTNLNQPLHDLRSVAREFLSLLESTLSSEANDSSRAAIESDIQNIQELLRDTEPRPYEVAIVGRFKAGKSSFVNTLCALTIPIASVDVQPNTAAITSFKFDVSPSAEVLFLSRQEWNDMRDASERDPNALEAARYRRIRQSEADHTLHAPLATLEQRFLSVPNNRELIPCPDWTDRDEQLKFARHIRDYVSKGSDYHFFVKRLTVYLPTLLLEDDIEIIDTPGLDDPDVYRVQLTEKALETADAVLFLTPSGDSFSQSDKTFIMKLLRSENIKALRIIVTKRDITFTNAAEDAQARGENAVSLAKLAEDETTRLRGVIRETMRELLANKEVSSKQRTEWVEKLQTVPIDFISVRFHEKGRIEEGGIEQLEQKLRTMLARSGRLSRAKRSLIAGLQGSFGRLHEHFTARKQSVEGELNADQVKREARTIQGEVGRFLSDLANRRPTYEEQFRGLNARDGDLRRKAIEKSQQTVEIVVLRHESDELRKNWQTLKNENSWGNWKRLLEEIANGIFPEVQEELDRQARYFDGCLQELSSSLESLEESLAAPNHTRVINITQVFKDNRRSLEIELGEQARNRQARINGELERFASKNLASRFVEAKARIAEISGDGTVTKQQEQIKGSYKFVKETLQRELAAYLSNQFSQSAEYLLGLLTHVLPDLKKSIDEVVARQLDSIVKDLMVAKRQKVAPLIRQYDEFLVASSKINERLESLARNERQATAP